MHGKYCAGRDEQNLNRARRFHSKFKQLARTALGSLAKQAVARHRALMKRVALLICLVAACERITPPENATPPNPGSCGAQHHQDLPGQDATVLERILILGQVRVIRPDTMVTTDWVPDRLNFQVDRAGRISRVYCG